MKEVVCIFFRHIEVANFINNKNGGHGIFFKNASYFFSLFALFASEISSVMDVNFTLYLCITALYPSAITKLSKERFACEVDALKAVEKLKKSLKLTQVETTVNTIAVYAKRGRPTKDAQPDTFEYEIVCRAFVSSLIMA